MNITGYKAKHEYVSPAGIRSVVYLMDCMEGMKQMPDNYFDLAIVDPPYGIGISSNPFRQKHKKQGWDNAIPNKEYFDKLKIVSKNQIIWGGNYFELEPTQGFLIWDKIQPFDFSSAMCEMAWMSFQSPAKIYKKHVVTAENDKIHPTQKPVKLYDWIFQNYTEPNQTILDTHLGSQSSRIAATKHDLTFIGFEIDEEYFADGNKRFDNYVAQTKLF